MKHKLLFCCLVVFLGCKDAPEQIPAYLYIKPFTVNAQGDASWHKVTEGWLYVNGDYLGSYTLPATVPILADGQSEVWLYPGVKKNGIMVVDFALQRIDQRSQSRLRMLHFLLALH